MPAALFVPGDERVYNQERSKEGRVTITLRMWSVAVVVVATACAHVERPRSPASSETYRFSEPLPGLGWVSGWFDVNATGRVTKFGGACSEALTPVPGPTSVSCRVEHLGVVAHDDSTLWTVAVKVLVSETVPWQGDATRSQVRNRIHSGLLSIAR